MAHARLPPDQVRGYVRVDPVALHKRMRERGVTTAHALARLANIDLKTANRLLANGRPQSGTMAKVCAALGVDDLAPLLSPSATGTPAPPDVAAGHPLGVGEWRAASRPTGWVEAANGLQFRRVRLINRYFDSQHAWGKQYELSHLSDSQRGRVEEALARHPEVCRRLEKSPRFPGLLTVRPADDGESWWVLERHYEGPSLEERLLRGPVGQADAGRLARELLAGLRELHEAGVVWRELSPASVWVGAQGDVVLTDFELGKLLDGSPTVSKEWRTRNDYRAPEVTAPDADLRADLYSFGRVMTHTLTGSLPGVGQEEAALTACEAAKRVRGTLLGCLAALPSERPDSAAAVLKRLGRWG